MRRIGGLLSCGCIAGVFALAVLQGSLAAGQDAKPVAAAAGPAVRRPAGEPDNAIRGMLNALGGGAPDLRQILEEQRARYRALMVSELDFCRAACDLTKEQSERIVKKAAVMIEEAAAKGARLELVPRVEAEFGSRPTPCRQMPSRSCGTVFSSL